VTEKEAELITLSKEVEEIDEAYLNPKETSVTVEIMKELFNKD
jgi:hypothetical protein